MIMIITNKHTREKREISYENFRKEFRQDIERAFQGYAKTEKNKKLFMHVDDIGLESDFYFDFRWNFNNHGNSAWYIDKI